MKNNAPPGWPRYASILAAITVIILLSFFSGLACRPADAARLSSLCIPDFPYKDGWYGGDGAWSLDLGDGRVLWLFGDSFVSSREGLQDRSGMQLVLGTTVAVSTCTAGGEFRIRYRLKKRDGEFVSFFGDGEWLWPGDPFLVRGTVYVPLVSIEEDPDRPKPFAFKITDHRIAKIEDFKGRDPLDWKVDYLDLSPGVLEGVHAFAATSVPHGRHVYFFPLYGATVNGLTLFGNILARVSLEALSEPGEAVEYLTGNGKWKRNPRHDELKVVLDAAVPEMSVRYHPERGKWVAVYLSIEGRGDRMLFRTADKLEGPWEEPEVLLSPIPEVDPESPFYDDKTFCYAGKEHFMFSMGRIFVVSYVCNSEDDPADEEGFICKNLFLYRPVVRTVLH